MSVNKTPSIVSMYVEQKSSIPDISRQLGLPKTRIRNMLLKQGVTLRTRAEGVRLAGYKTANRLRGVKRQFSPEHCLNISIGKKRMFEGKAKGFEIHNGYIRLTRGENCRRNQHVVIMEEHIGRKLHADEVVHHRNGNKQDNRISNLQLMTRAEHSKLHAIMRNQERKIYNI